MAEPERLAQNSAIAGQIGSILSEIGKLAGNAGNLLLNHALFIYITLACALVYICVCGPSKYHRNGWIGALYIILINLPDLFGRCACTILCCGRDRGFRWVNKTERYFCESRNPVLQIFYTILVGVAVVIWFWKVFDMLPRYSMHRFAAPFAIVALVGCFVAACRADPGVITPENAKHQRTLFPYDGLMYSQRSTECTTCELPKPARSKHCRICNHCVAKFDHHCAWLNGDVGLKNYRHFLLFLLSHAFVCLYGTYLCVYVLMRVADDLNLWKVSFIMGDNSRAESSYYLVFLFLLQRHHFVIGVALFMVMIALMLLGFFSYHAYLITTNFTTNETFKWDDAKQWHKEHGKLSQFQGYRNVYNRGFVQNWKEVLFPPTDTRRSQTGREKKKPS